MAKPAHTSIDHDTQGWDVAMNDNFGVAFSNPFPVYEDAATSLAALETNKPAASFDRCLCFFNDTTLGWCLARSNGTAWTIFGIKGTDPSDISGTTGGTGTTLVSPADPADAPADADALREDLVLNALPTIRNNFEALKAKVNGILAAMRTAGQM